MAKKTPKYATITLKYYDTEDHLPNATRILTHLSEAITEYNNNCNFGYSKMELVWFSVEPDEMSIEEQNKFINDKENGK